MTSNDILRIGPASVDDNGEETIISTSVSARGETRRVGIHASSPRMSFSVPAKVDAFLPLLLPYAIEHGLSVVCDGKVSAELIYTMNDYFLPTMARACGLPLINLKAPLISASESRDRRHRDGIAVLDVGYATHEEAVLNKLRSFDGMESVQAYVMRNEAKCGSERHASEEGIARDPLPFIEIYDDMDGDFGYPLVNKKLLSSLSSALFLQDMVSVYYIPTGHSIDDYAVEWNDFSRSELMFASCFSTEAVTIDIVGLES